jgi:hypothetical protein
MIHQRQPHLHERRDTHVHRATSPQRGAMRKVAGRARDLSEIVNNPDSCRHSDATTPGIRFAMGKRRTRQVDPPAGLTAKNPTATSRTTTIPLIVCVMGSFICPGNEYSPAGVRAAVQTLVAMAIPNVTIRNSHSV